MVKEVKKCEECGERIRENEPMVGITIPKKIWYHFDHSPDREAGVKTFKSHQ